MPFILSDEEDVSTQPSKGFILSDGPEEGASESFSPMRAAGTAGKEFLLGMVNSAASAFGGGPTSPMELERQYQKGLKEREYLQKEEDLTQQGLSEEEIIKQIGKPSASYTPREAFDVATEDRFHPQNVLERNIAAASEAAGEFVSIGALTGGRNFTREAGIGALFGTGEQLAKEADLGPVGQFLSGVFMASTPYLMKKGGKAIQYAVDLGKEFFSEKKLPDGIPSFLEETSQKSLADLELSQKDMTTRLGKVTTDIQSKFDNIISKSGESSFRDLKDFNAAEIEKSLIKENQNAILDTISPAGKTDKSSWEGIQKYVEGNFRAAKKTYGELYDLVEAESTGIHSVPYETAPIVNDIYKDLNASLLQIPEESGIRNALGNILNDLKPMIQGTGELVGVPVKKLLATKRSIGRLLRRSDIIPAPVDLLKPVSEALKKDITKALGENKRNLQKMYESAENIFSETQRVYNNDAILKMRKSELPEDLTSFFTKPSNLERLNEAIGENPQVRNFLDRLVVEEISKKGKGAAAKFANENREFLGKKANEALDKILEYGDSLTSPGQQALTRNRILEDLQTAFDTGKRPTYTLDLIQNPKGYALVKNLLSKNKNGDKLFKSLERLVFEDMFNSIFNEKKAIDFTKANNLLSNPHTRKIIHDRMGNEGTKFFQNLEKYGRNLTENLRMLSLKDRPFLQRLVDTYLDKGMKYVLYALAPFTLGKSLLPILGVEIAQKAYRNKLFKILENPQAQKAIEKLGRKSISKEEIEKAFRTLSQISTAQNREE